MLRRMINRFKAADIGVMLHPGRCGSTVVGNMLDQHPTLSWRGEILTHRHDIQIPERLEPRSDWAKLLREMRRSCCRDIVGIEIKTRQLFKEGLHFEDLADRIKGLTEFSSFPPIFLHRKNHLLRLASALEARMRRKHNYRKGEQPEKRCVSLPRLITDTSYRVENKDISEWLEVVERTEKRIAECIIQFGGVVMNYECDVEVNPSAAYETVVRHFGESAPEAQVEMVRVNDLVLRDRISNFDQVKSWLTSEQVMKYCF